MERRPADELLVEVVTQVTGAKTLYSYALKVDFPVQENKGSFNLKEYFTKLMQEIKSMNRDIIIGATNEENNWTNPKELPTGNKFTKAFSVKHEMHNNKPRIIMFAKIKTTWK
eukprot:8087004-Ditylum_brightwellii.AAC.1